MAEFVNPDVRELAEKLKQVLLGLKRENAEALLLGERILLIGPASITTDRDVSVYTVLLHVSCIVC